MNAALPNRIVLAGNGNLAKALLEGPLPLAFPHMELWCRNGETQDRLAAQFAIKAFDSANPNPALIILAVSDQAIETVMAHFRTQARVFVHFSGSAQPMAKVPVVACWPVHSFSNKETVPWNAIPWMRTAGNSEIEQWALKCCDTLGGTQRMVSAEARRKLHLAAVILNNFGNHLIARVQEYCTENQLDSASLQHLTEQTVLRLRDVPATEVQTGPAKRHDTETMQQHLAMLQSDRELKEIYELFSKLISERYL